MGKTNSYNNYHQRVQNTPNIVEVDDRLWEYVIVKPGYYKGRYYKMHKNNNGLSWNTAAFLVPECWFAYRKMYLEAFLLWLVNAVYGVILTAIVWLICGNLFVEWGIPRAELWNIRNMTQDEVVAWMMPYYEKMAETLTATQIEEAINSTIHQLDIAVAIFLFIGLIFRLVVALTANMHYLNRIQKLVRTEAHLDKESTAAQRNRKGGVSAGAVVLLLGINFLITLLIRTV